MCNVAALFQYVQFWSTMINSKTQKQLFSYCFKYRNYAPFSVLVFNHLSIDILKKHELFVSLQFQNIVPKTVRMHHLPSLFSTFSREAGFCVTFLTPSSIRRKPRAAPGNACKTSPYLHSHMRPVALVFILHLLSKVNLRCVQLQFVIRYVFSFRMQVDK